MSPKQTPSQTLGPYFSYCLTPGQYEYPLTDIAGANLIEGGIDGDRIRVTGQVLDGEGKPIDDAMIEIWQADPQGRYAHPADPRGSNSRFRGFGRVGTGTDPDNRFFFDTVKPGCVDDSQAPHLNMIVHMRGMLNHLIGRASELARAAIIRASVGVISGRIANFRPPRSSKLKSCETISSPLLSV